MSEARAALLAGAAALQLPLEESAVARLLQYLALLRKWNRVYNLTSVRETSQMLTRHLVDCLAIVPPLRRELLRSGVPPPERRPRLLDVGSGAGLPGIVLAVCFPELDVGCVDAVGKKAAFVRQVAAELGLANLQAIHARVETLRASHATAYDFISARAFASLSGLVRGSSHLLADDGLWLAMKAKLPQSEIDELAETARLFHVEQLHVLGLDEQRCLVWLQKSPPPADASAGSGDTAA